MEALPRLRMLEAFPIEHDGKELVALRDPLGLVPGVALVSPQLYLAASYFDGRHRLEDVRELLHARHGVAADIETLREIAGSLSERLLLEDEKFRRAFDALRADFAASPVRPAFHAGMVYPGEASEAKEHIEAMLAADGGSSGERASVAHSKVRPLPAAILSPHIDYARGAKTYAKTWAPLRSRAGAPLFVVLGTSHAPMESLLGLTKKDYETPFGNAQTDREFVQALSSRLPEDSFVDEFRHRGEHSVELQIHILRALFPQAKFAPILCGHLDREGGGASPGGAARVETAVAALQACLRERPGAVLVLGVDLAHVGPRFGFPALLDAEYLTQVERADRASLDRAAARDAEGFYRAVMEGNDPRKVCGLSPIYLGLRCLDARRGELLDYRQCTSEDQSVTIAGMIWERR